MADEWSDTQLWEAIGQDESESGKKVRSTLEPFLRDVQAVLDDAGTSGQSFTLHDGGHSFRVAERMYDVIPSDVFAKLTRYESTQLLLSAYLHDVGMTPEAGRRTAHREFLLGNESEDGALSEDESDAFVAWLDADGISYPAKLSPRDGEQIVERYVRDRHVDWGEEWTLAQTEGLKLASYQSWRSDLCALCRSHGEGYTSLADSKFEPRTVDAAGSLVHLRYLALVLRMADVLEFDPERTPEAVYRHRAIDPSSKIYWYKDKEISLDIEDAGQIMITARPPSALIHKAVEETADDVDRELALCRHVADTHHIDYRPGSKNRLPHRWDLPARAWRDVQPAADSYEYIDGAFRPNTDRVLELVAGTALYAEPFAAVRELLSNGFDAVRAASALERAERDGKDGGRTHRLTLSMEQEDEQWWLTCRDTGIGMDKRAIERHFLVAGSPLRSRLLDIARRSREDGFELERSGEFGIGVLSYFMLADKISMTTNEAGGSEGGWCFEVEELEGFGELRPTPNAPIGTTVRLRLREGLFENAGEWAEQLLIYLHRTMIRMPCAFEASLAPLEDPPWRVEPGWASETDQFARYVLASLRHHEADPGFLELMSKRSRIAAEEQSAEASGIFEDASERLRWHVHEGELSDGLGWFRVCIPYWELEGGPSRLYLRARGTGAKQALGSFDHLPFPGSAIAGSTDVRAAWYGMRSEIEAGLLDTQSLETGIVEIDFDSGRAGEIQLRRDQAQLSEAATNAMLALKAEIRRVSAELSDKLGRSAFRSLNMAYGLGEGAAEADDWRWLVPLGSKDSPAWEKIRFPCISVMPQGYGEQQPRRATLHRKRVTALPCLMDPAELSIGLPWHGGGVSPDRVVWYENRGSSRSAQEVGVMPLWQQAPEKFADEELSLAEFPPEWETLCGVHWRKYGNARSGRFRYSVTQKTVWNEGMPLIDLAHREAREWAEKTFNPTPTVVGDWYARLAAAVDPLAHKDKLSDPAFAAAWLLQLASSEISPIEGLWSGIAERDEGYLKDLWSRLGLVDEEGEKTIMYLTVGDDSFESVLNLVSPTTWQRRELKTKDDWATLPLPGKAWQLSIRVDD